MVQRVRNVIKTSNKKVHGNSEICEARTKRRKTDKYQLLRRRYPINNSEMIDDPQSIEGHLKGLETELKKAKPRDNVLLPLMKSTFQERRDRIIDTQETVSSVLLQYPALSRLAVVSI